MDVYRIFRKDGPERRVALFMREQRECMEPCLGTDKPAENLSKDSGQTKMVNVVVGFCCRLQDQEEVVDEAFWTTGRSLMFTGSGLCRRLQQP